LAMFREIVSIRGMGLSDFSRRVFPPLSRRRSLRVRGELAVDWHVFGAAVRHRCVTVDLSNSGALVSAVRPAKVGSPIVMALAMPDGPVEVHGYVAWSSAAAMGVRFTRPLPSLSA
jgi:hypothetical protein